MFDFLAGTVPRRELAWDCATGNGQAAVGLARVFGRVVATDASAAQVRHATPHPHVRYAVSRAEATGLRDGLCDIVTVAQALHWIDRPTFYAEVRRLLAPQGVLAVWCYGLLEIGPAIDAELRRFYHDTVGPFWPPERRMIEDAYRSIEFPFTELTAPRFSIDRPLTLDGLIGYVRTWSATRGYIARHHHDPVEDLLPRLRELWGTADEPRLTRAPVYVRAGRVPVRTA